MTTTITRQIVSVNQRVNITADLFCVQFSLLEPFVYSMTSKLSCDYSGGYWQFYTLSNGGFYMSPNSDGTGEALQFYDASLRLVSASLGLHAGHGMLGFWWKLGPEKLVGDTRELRAERPPDPDGVAHYNFSKIQKKRGKRGVRRGRQRRHQFPRASLREFKMRLSESAGIGDATFVTTGVSAGLSCIALPSPIGGPRDGCPQPAAPATTPRTRLLPTRDSFPPHARRVSPPAPT